MSSPEIHPHAYPHDHGLYDREADLRSLSTALGLLVSFMLAEVVAGLLAGSLALMADAAHMLTDVAAIGAGLFAARLAARPASGSWTFGWKRAEVLSAQGNGISLLVVAAVIGYEAIRRLIDPPSVEGGVLVLVASIGVVVNLAATWILRRGSRRSMNVEGAYLHVLTDMLAFAGTVVAGIVVLTTGWRQADPVASLLVVALMLRTAWQLLAKTGRVLLEAAPEGIEPDTVLADLVADPRVESVHDLHVWLITSGFPAISAHVLVEPGADCHGVRRDLEDLLAARHGIEHTTLQVDHTVEHLLSIEARPPTH